MSQATLGSTPYTNSGLFSGYYLDERIYDLDGWDCQDDALDAFEDLQNLWSLEQEVVASYNEDELLDVWIDEVLDVLGFGTLSEPTIPDGGGYNDRLLFESDDTRRKGAKRKRDGDVEAAYNLASAVLEAKQWDADFTLRFSEHRSYRDASHQIKYYLEHTPENLQWGILTDGRKWRLYGTKDYATEIYYEVDLPELLETGSVEQFKYFYAFFRPEAFREIAGTSFLDTVWNESETAAKELGEDLQDNVFTALRLLGEGFIHTNDLEIDPDDEEARKELKKQSLVLLYRLMFVLYAESRDLIHPEEPGKQQEYEDHFSLNQIRLDIHEEIQSGDSFEDFSGFATQIWGQLEDLFHLINEGEPELGIPPYNGGLFDDQKHEFLAENEVADRYIAEVIYRLGTTEAEDGQFVLADYADLDTRHLGSIYEGLLEHEFRIAPEQYAAVSEDGTQVWKPGTEVSVAEAVETVDKGDLYVVNDEGERKATGAYYTPDYVVSYIVEETVAPLIEDIKADLEAQGLKQNEPEYFRQFWQEVLDLKILDPAMGSAHFLTRATGYLTEQVMEVVREQEIQSYGEQHLRREIAKECIYGVDINGMAVELAKLSMWLETLAADQPLAFLDHHLREGNSLVGSDITEVLSEDKPGEESAQLTFTEVFARSRKQTLEHVMDLMQELLAIDNETLEDVKSMEEILDEIREDPLYKRLFEIANVHTGEEFDIDVPDQAYEEMAGAVQDESEWAEVSDNDWFISAQSIAEEGDFFHWELEYPEVFFGEDGEKQENAGFDAVIGNPPWVNIGRVSGNEPMVEYAKSVFETAEYQVDLYTLFLEKSMDIVGKHQFVGMIVPDPWLNNYRTPMIRKLLLVENSPVQLISTPPSAFPEVGAEHLIGIFRKGDLSVTGFERGKMKPGADVEIFDNYPTSLLSENDEYIVYSHSNVFSAINQIESKSTPLGDLYETIRGVGPYHHNYQDKEVIENREYHSSEKKDETFVPELKGKHLSRYNVDWKGDTWISYGDWLAEPREKRFFEGKRLLLREILGKRFEVAVLEDEFITDRSIYIALPEDNSPDLYYTLSILASSVPVFWFREKHNEDDELFPKLRVAHFEMLPIPTPKSIVDGGSKSAGYISDFKEGLGKDDLSPLLNRVTSHIQEQGVDKSIHDLLTFLGKLQSENQQKLTELNLSLRDHFGSYSDGQSLGEIGLTQPPKGSADSVLQQTSDKKPNLKVGEATVKRESRNTVEIRLTARYKPDDEEAFETDQWGYTETEPLPALHITNLKEIEADLIEEFVPVAVSEAGGFARFRGNATKTISLVDRLHKLTLPAIDDVRESLGSYMKTKHRADELDQKIETTDEFIDQIVYNLYGLAEEEIAIVEERISE